MYRFAGMGLAPGAGRISVPTTDSTVALSSGRDTGIAPLLRTGGVPVARPTVFGYPDDSFAPVPEQVPVQDQGEDAGSTQVMVSSAAPASASSAAVAVAATTGSSIPWWGWAIGIGAVLFAFKGGR